jgi:hypothetical protein
MLFAGGRTHTHTHTQIFSQYSGISSHSFGRLYSMMIQLTLIKENLEHNKAGMPFEWMGVSKELRLFLDKEAGKGISDQITYINNMLAEMYQMNPTEVRNFDPLNVESDEEQNASKTQGTPPGALEARPKEGATTPDMRAGRDKGGCNHWAWQLVTNIRHPSNRATAEGGGTSSTAAKISTSSS